jgi:hypothetical protein
MTGAVALPPALDRHVVIVTSAGSFTPAGTRLTGPVSSVDKLETLIDWAHGRGLLRPISGDQHHGGDTPARLWVVGSAWRQLAGSSVAHELPEGVSIAGEDPAEPLSRALAVLVGRGWELSGNRSLRFELARGRGPHRVRVELLVEPRPWLGGVTAETVADDAGELGRRLTRWVGELGVLPDTSGALSAAALLDQIMRARAARSRGGAVITTPGVLPARVCPCLRVQPEWVADRQMEKALDHADELLWLQQECPQLASAGMLTLGHGRPQTLHGAPAAAAAAASKRPFALWRAKVPPTCPVTLPDRLPAPHPQMHAGEQRQVWLTTEDLDGLCKDVRDGGAGLAVEQLGIDEAIVWPQQGRLLEAWATRLREARQRLIDDTVLRALVDSAAADYIAALADPHQWAEGLRHHFQPAWLAAIAAHVRMRGRRAAIRIAREYRVWPVYVRDAAMIYAVGCDESTGAAIDLSDTHTRLGRMIVTQWAKLTDETVLATVIADTPARIAEALLAALNVTATQDEPIRDASAPLREPTAAAPPEAESNDARGAEAPAPAEAAPVEPPSSSEDDKDKAPQDKTHARRSRVAARTKTKPPQAGSPAAVLHTDGLWLSDGTRVDLPEPIAHVGQVAELAYTHSIGYPLSANFAEPGQIWITREACRAVGIDVEAIARRDRTKSLRQLTEGIDFVALAVTEGWALGGAGEDPSAQRLGTWTRIYRQDRDNKRGVMIALIPGMGAGPDEMPILADDAAPAQIARRLQLLADALRFPWKINAGVTAVDLMLQARPKTWSPQDWRDIVFAASTTTPPFGIGDVESDFDWSRPPTSDERKLKFVHAYDRGGSYVAGIAGQELPIGDPVHHPDGAPFDPKTPGYWLVAIPEQADWRLPYVLNPRRLQFSGPKWVCTPRLERAIALGYQPEILEARIWPQHSRNVLLGWYERFRDASTTLDTNDPDAQAARDQAKIIRTHGLGVIGSDEHLKGKTAYNPERRLHVMAKANSNIVYRFNQIGERTERWPLAAATDTVLYASDDPDPVTAWPGDPASLGRGFGQYKPEASGLLAEHIDYLNGRDYRGKRELTPAAEWRDTLPRSANPDGNR